jgi:WD40 repeat protein
MNKLPGTLIGHTGVVRALVVVPDGSWLASIDSRGELRVWDPVTAAPLTSLRVTGSLPHLALASTTIAAAGEQGLYFLTSTGQIVVIRTARPGRRSGDVNGT